MADSTAFHRFVLQTTSPWNLPGQTDHKWHNKFSVSGTIEMNAADAEATAIALWDPIRRVTTPKSSLTYWSYYPSGTNVALHAGVPAAGATVGDSSGYASVSDPEQQLEVTIVARCPVGTNSRGKEVYLRKWIHDVRSSPGDPNSHGGFTDEAVILGNWTTGSGPHAVVPIDPTSGNPGGPWTIETHLYTHQLRRGPRKKKVPAGIIAKGITATLQDLQTLSNALGSVA
jgi:hypothetical protein